MGKVLHGIPFKRLARLPLKVDEIPFGQELWASEIEKGQIASYSARCVGRHPSGDLLLRNVDVGKDWHEPGGYHYPTQRDALLALIDLLRKDIAATDCIACLMTTVRGLNHAVQYLAEIDMEAAEDP